MKEGAVPKNSKEKESRNGDRGAREQSKGDRMEKAEEEDLRSISRILTTHL